MREYDFGERPKAIGDTALVPFVRSAPTWSAECEQGFTKMRTKGEILTNFWHHKTASLKNNSFSLRSQPSRKQINHERPPQFPPSRRPSGKSSLCFFGASSSESSVAGKFRAIA